ncbi:MAG: TonB-dependent receptor [Bacteroidia bacterium]|nr:TonB-dependent receptor [Bacteroidia bacterium]
MKIWSILFVLLVPSFLLSQVPTQTLRGTITDADSRQPLAGVKVTIVDSSPEIGAITDALGKYEITQVPLGRQQVLASLTGFSDSRSDFVPVTSTRAVVVDLTLSELLGEARVGEVNITASEFPHKATNPLSVVSTRSFSAEETQRYPAGVNDPGRMALTYPGVQQGGDDSENDIIIRGNSSFGMLWRLEGIDMPNPNHFARAGTSGGGITVFSAQLLANSDFSTGAFAAEYGNAISGVFDIHFRKGNMEGRNYRAKASLLGLDFSAEGPIAKGRSSYLVNYRYSTLGLLNKMGFYLVGERVSNDFQDLSFNLAFDGKDGKTFVTVFGMGGLSLERYEPVANAADREPGVANQWEDRNRTSDMAATGVTVTRLINDKSYLKWTTALISSNIYYEYDTLDREDIRYRYNTEQYLDTRLTTSLSYTNKLSSRTRLKTGLFFNQIFFRFFQESSPRSTDVLDKVLSNISIDGEGNTRTYQAYAQLSHSLNEKWTLNAGVHSILLELNQTGAVEPRVSLQFSPSGRHSVSAAYGWHSQMLPLGAYYYRQNDTLVDGTVNISFPNSELPFIRSHHFVVAYNGLFLENIRFNVEAYLQQLSRVPVEPVASDWWWLNNRSGVAQFPLVGEGTGLNYGVDVALEKFFSGGMYFLLTYSRFQSTYQTLEGVDHPTRFSTRYASTYTLGKEFSFKKGSVLQIGARVLYNGGFRYTPFDPVLSQEQGIYVPLAGASFEGQVSPYFRIDTRIAYTRNRENRSTILSLDIQNVLNRPNANDIRYNATTNELEFRRHPGGLIPVLSYQVDF